MRKRRGEELGGGAAGRAGGCERRWARLPTPRAPMRFDQRRRTGTCKRACDPEERNDDLLRAGGGGELLRLGEEGRGRVLLSKFGGRLDRIDGAIRGRVSHVRRLLLPGVARRRVASVLQVFFPRDALVMRRWALLHHLAVHHHHVDGWHHRTADHDLGHRRHVHDVLDAAVHAWVERARQIQEGLADGRWHHEVGDLLLGAVVVVLGDLPALHK